MRLALFHTVVAALLLGAAHAIVAGVDFGGEFFKIALVKPGTPFEIVTNIHSKRKTETMVAFDGDERLYGADAVTVGVRRPHSAYSQIRRFLGTSVESPQVLSLLKEEYYPYELFRNATRGTVALRHNKDHVFHAEELVAMVFSHARQITDSFAEAPVKDWVVTVPSFFTQAQRQAVLDAAELANVHALALVNENTAAALQLGVHSTFESPKRVVLYNMGSTSLQVSVVEFTSTVVPDGFKKNKTVTSFQVLANAWDDGLGGAKFDLKLADYFADLFNAQLEHEEDVRELARPMAKLRAQAKKTKIVLSANERIPVVLQSLYKDMDLITHMTRSKFEEINAALFAETLRPVQRALEQSGLQVSDIDDVEIIGGAVRMPKIQAQLREFFQGKNLGVHLNGDEAMALGAAFHAANLSSSFRVRHVGMTDIASYPIGVRLVDMDHGSEEEQEGEQKHWVKRAALFGETSRLGMRKAVSFLHDKDIAATFRYDKPSGLPQGVNIHIAKFNITGVEAFAAEHADKQLGQPKVTLSFELDRNGLVKIVRAEATLEEEYEVEVEVSQKNKKEKEEEKKEKEKEEEKEATADDSENESSTETPTEKVVEKRTKTHRGVLTIVQAYSVHDADAGMSVLPMTVSDKKDSIRMLRAMEEADNQRKANLDAKNRLETFVYRARDELTAKEEVVKHVTVPEQVTSLQSKLEETEDWLYDEGDKVEAQEYTTRLEEMQRAIDAIMFRVAERKELPIAISSAKEYTFSTRELMNEWQESKPQVSEEERQDVLDKADELDKWLDEAEAKQKAAAVYEDPVVTSREVAKKTQGLRKLVSSLAKKPLPTPPKTEEDEAQTSDKDTTDTNTNTNTNTDADTAAPEAEDAGGSASSKEEESPSSTEAGTGDGHEDL